MVFQNQSNCECLRSSPVTDSDGVTYCEGCGLELLEFQGFEGSIHSNSEDMVLNPRATSSLPRRLQIHQDRLCAPRFRAKQAAIRLVKKIHPNNDSVRKIALEYIELGWDESTPLLKAEPHLCRFGHPHGTEYVAAACLYRARQTVGVCSDRIQLAELCLEATGVAPSTRKINRTVKGLNLRIRLKQPNPQNRQSEGSIAYVRPLAELALSNFPELSPIRMQLIDYGEGYCRANPVRSGNPLNMISALAYVLQRTAGIGLNREQVRTAFGATTTMGHFIPEMKKVIANDNFNASPLSVSPRTGVPV
jgi:hypothetical protein